MARCQLSDITFLFKNYSIQRHRREFFCNAILAINQSIMWSAIASHTPKRSCDSWARVRHGDGQPPKAGKTCEASRYRFRWIFTPTCRPCLLHFACRPLSISRVQLQSIPVCENPSFRTDLEFWSRSSSTTLFLCTYFSIDQPLFVVFASAWRRHRQRTIWYYFAAEVSRKVREAARGDVRKECCETVALGTFFQLYAPAKHFEKSRICPLCASKQKR